MSYTLAVSENIIGRLIGHNTNNRRLDGHYIGITNKQKPLNWFATRDFIVNTILPLMARWNELLISWNV
jgi:hypothetical protein